MQISVSTMHGSLKGRPLLSALLVIALLMALTAELSHAHAHQQIDSSCSFCLNLCVGDALPAVAPLTNHSTSFAEACFSLSDSLIEMMLLRANSRAPPPYLTPIV